MDSRGRIDCDFNHNWIAIGSGMDDTKIILTQEWNENMNMKQFVTLGYSIVRHVEEEKPSGTVGVGIGKPSVRYLGKGTESDSEPSATDWTEFEASYSNYHTCFKKYALSKS